jgi:hypothetical protein
MLAGGQSHKTLGPWRLHHIDVLNRIAKAEGHVALAHLVNEFVHNLIV